MTVTEPRSRPDTTPADVWRQKTVHTVTAPSGAVLRMRIPGIGTLLELDQLPHHLVSVALLDMSHKGAESALQEMLDDVLDEERRGKILGEIKKLGEYHRRLVAAALVEPQVTYEDIAAGEFPEEDLVMVAEIVKRTRDFDARGVRIGVEPLDRWATFHSEHGLGNEDCDSCKRVVAALSSLDVGEM